MLCVVGYKSLQKETDFILSAKISRMKVWLCRQVAGNVAGKFPL